MFFSSFSVYFRLPLARNAHFRCKVTTKNAHTQENEHFFWKKIDFIYHLSYYLCARREFTHKRVYRWWLKWSGTAIFLKKVWVSVVWAAFRERNFEVGEPFLRARSVPSKYYFFRTYASATRIFFIKSQFRFHIKSIFASFFFSYFLLYPLCMPTICHLPAPYLHRNLIGTSSESHRNLAEWWTYHQATNTET